jgi:hypothetical protein
MARQKQLESRTLVILLSILVLVLGGALIYQHESTTEMQNINSVERARDAIRISDVDQIHQAVRDFHTKYGVYPNCLYKSDCKNSLEGTSIMPKVAKDPLTGTNYSYAAYGPGSTCTIGYHIGASLERPTSQALITGLDGAPQADNLLCAGSPKDFSGLSYAKGGEPCDKIAGVPAPSDVPTTETCYDVGHQNAGQSAQ